MKKKNLTNLSVKKSTISNLNKGGLSVPQTDYRVCGTGPETIYYCVTKYCSLLSPCDYNSVNRCKTIEVDGNTLPIC
ncbi:hypothetical protein C8N46_103467 [Kordia periserrulae]|uniref:Uncharacterized protein n=1 Tax=Kordia periserrulae TaxID=701523 RepID=A0A2T6C294_9FLAO|nr:hypothetical protein [Kordia periserrulae]PTX62367.1 hypothetical protein C8N46_103467 [Kordia periserrulae]